MDERIRTATPEDMPEISAIYANARKKMAESGNPTQWGDQKPAETTLRQDILRGQLYVICREGSICGVFCLAFGEDPTYREIDGAWHSTAPYGTIHRVAGFGGGIFAACVRFCRERSGYLRVDTHEKNTAMRRAIEREGFSCCGIIHVEDGSPRLAFDWRKEQEK